MIDPSSTDSFVPVRCSGVPNFRGVLGYGGSVAELPASVDHGSLQVAVGGLLLPHLRRKPNSYGVFGGL